MGKRSLTLALLVAAGAASAETPELLRRNAEFEFRDSLASISSKSILPSPGDMVEGAYVDLLKRAMADYFKSHTTFPKPAGIRRPTVAPVMSLDLAESRNRQWSNPAKVGLGGVPSSLCGQISRGLKAFFAVMPDGDNTPSFFSADDLLDGKPRMAVAGRAYGISLAVNILDPLGSKLKFKDEADARLSKSVTLRRLLEVAHASGELLVAGEPMYRVFWGQDVVDGVPPAPGKTESFVFILQKGDDYYTYLVARELVPTDASCALFPLHRNQAVCLRQSQSKLDIFLP